MAQKVSRLGAVLAVVGMSMMLGACGALRWPDPAAATPDAGRYADANVGPLGDAASLQTDAAWSGRGGGLDDAGGADEDAAMALPLAPTEPFTIEPADTRIEVHAGDRAMLPIRIVRAPEHLAWIELHAQGLPRGVAALYAVSRDPSEVALVIEASDTAVPVRDLPFTIEANGAGVRCSRRILLTVLPEAPVPEE